MYTIIYEVILLWHLQNKYMQTEHYFYITKYP